METAQIIVKIGTINHGRLINNVITLDIPKEAANLINTAWHTEDLPQRYAINAHNLLGNQIGFCDLVINGKVTAGMQHMIGENSDNEHFFEYRNYEDTED